MRNKLSINQTLVIRIIISELEKLNKNDVIPIRMYDSQSNKITSTKINHRVAWLRTKINECIDKGWYDKKEKITLNELREYFFPRIRDFYSILHKN